MLSWLAANVVVALHGLVPGFRQHTDAVGAIVPASAACSGVVRFAGALPAILKALRPEPDSTHRLRHAPHVMQRQPAAAGYRDT
jgi:hypothetical protein